MVSVCVASPKIISLGWMDSLNRRRKRSDGWQWLKDFEHLRSLRLSLRTQVAYSLWISRLLFVVPCFRTLKCRRIGPLSARRWRATYSGCNLMQRPRWIKWVIVLFKLSSIAEAQVSPLSLLTFILLCMIYVDFPMNSLRVSPLGHHCCFRTSMLFACFHLIHVYLFGATRCEVFYLSQNMEVL